MAKVTARGRLSTKIEKQMSPLVKNGIYKHFKGKNYRLIDVVRHSESLEELVLYEALYDNELGKLWVRPLNLFLGFVENQGKLIPRFQYIGDKKGRETL